jgi:hypothetical protein
LFCTIVARHTNKQAEKYAYISAYRHIDRETDGQLDRHRQTLTDRGTNQQTYIQTDIRVGRQTYRQTDK